MAISERTGFQWYVKKFFEHNVIWGPLPERETRGGLGTAVVKTMLVVPTILIDLSRLSLYVFTCGTFHDGKADLLAIGEVYPWNYGWPLTSVGNRQLSPDSYWKDLLDAYEEAIPGSEEGRVAKRLCDQSFSGDNDDTLFSKIVSKRKKISLKLVQYLVERVGVNARTWDSWTRRSPLLKHLLFRYPSLESIDVVKLILDMGEDPNETGVLITAIKYGDSEVVTLLLERGATLTKGDILAAIKKKDKGIITAIIKTPKSIDHLAFLLERVHGLEEFNWVREECEQRREKLYLAIDARCPPATSAQEGATKPLFPEDIRNLIAECLLAPNQFFKNPNL